MSNAEIILLRVFGVDGRITLKQVLIEVGCYNLDCIDPAQENDQWRTRVPNNEHFGDV